MHLERGSVASAAMSQTKLRVGERHLGAVRVALARCLSATQIARLISVVAAQLPSVSRVQRAPLAVFLGASAQRRAGQLVVRSAVTARQLGAFFCTATGQLVVRVAAR